MGAQARLSDGPFAAFATIKHRTLLTAEPPSPSCVVSQGKRHPILGAFFGIAIRGPQNLRFWGEEEQQNELGDILA